MVLLKLTARESELPHIASVVCAHLKKDTSFALALVGDLGAGKTTLVQAILHHLGHPKHVPVLSPTFSYVHEYEVHSKLYAHLDLYRCAPEVELEDYVAYDYQSYAGLFVEWSERLAAEQSHSLTHRITIQHIDGEPLLRSYLLELIS